MSDVFSGMDVVMENLNAEVNKIKGRTFRGLLKAGLKVERLSNKRVPVEHGDLHSSSYTRKNTDGSLGVEVGYTAEHAVWIHENLEAKLKGKGIARRSGLGFYWGPTGEPKFLERTIDENIENIAAIIAADAELK